MKKDFLVDIPERPRLERLVQIPTTHDLASVLLYREAFNDFEKAVVKNNKPDLNADRLPKHWLERDYPDRRSADYICEVFSSQLPTLAEVADSALVFGKSLTIVGGGTCLINSSYGVDIDSDKLVCRLNHPYISDHKSDVGVKTTIHMCNERRLYDYTRQITRDDFRLLGALNICTGTTSKTAGYLEYARYLDSGGHPTHLVALKPSFLASIGALHPNKNPTLGFIATAFGLRVFGGVTLYGFDLGSTNKHYHGIDVVHSSHALDFEAAELINCEKHLHNFNIKS